MIKTDGARVVRHFALAVLASLGVAACSTAVKSPEPVRVNVFRGASNIPIYMAREIGAFERAGIAPEMQFTPSSDAQRSGLATGKFEIAHAAIDNAIAMVEMARQDVIIVAGGDGGMNEFLVRPEIMKPADLRNRTYVVDAPNTAYALIGRKILKDAGLADGRDFRINPIGGSEARTRAFETPDGAATMLNPPWNFIARDRGARSLGRTVDLYGPYQAGGIFVQRAWASSHRDLLERYVTAYVEGCRAAQDPARREQVTGVLARELKLDRRIAELTYADLMTRGHGLTADCAIDMPGMRNVLALRAEIEGQWGGVAPSPERYIDGSFYAAALRRLGRKD
jgi:ABC-type nitrate/sulfonate/bicarbonate transport system substrate-binding protein